ncbi:MAG: Holliday junction branch migration protein RuvA [Acidimicrobiales bacterium]
MVAVIGWLRGRVVDRESGAGRATLPEVIVEVGGVGYRVNVTSTALARFALDDEVVLHIHHHLWEADQKLYGFTTKAERVAFEGLLAAHGVGPALAMAVLATHPADRLARILADDDLAALRQVPGVGLKTAQRMLVELKSTLVLPDEIAPDDDQPGTRPTALADVGEALANLGYSADEIKKAVAGLDPADGDAGVLLRRALRSLAGSR